MGEKGTRRGGKRCLNEGTEALRGQEGRLTKRGDAETRGLGGRLSPTGKLHSVVGGPGGAQIPSREWENVPAESQQSILLTRVLGLLNQ